jgi:hypothetical protein
VVVVSSVVLTQLGAADHVGGGDPGMDRQHHACVDDLAVVGSGAEEVGSLMELLSFH